VGDRVVEYPLTVGEPQRNLVIEQNSLDEEPMDGSQRELKAEQNVYHCKQ
jgi:hypothetical protein